ncbi:sensor histidine kinase [Spirosoma fluminis]
MTTFAHQLLYRLPAVRPQTKWQLLLLLPWFIPLLTYWLLGDRYVADVSTFVMATMLNFSIGVTCLFILDQLTQRVVRRYPNIGQTWSRIWRLLTVFMLVTPLFILGGMYCYDHFHWFGYSHDSEITGRILFMNIGANVLSVGIDETAYSLTKWRENALEKEQLKKINLQSQFESLKNQVNPHFLFNSLNSLSSLIADDPQQAEQFVDEMSKVYRYLLQTNEGELTTLANELKFIDSYYHLLKTRYQAGICLNVDVPDQYLSCLLPPLTLQMLVENAVKHNIIQANKPLLLELTISEGQLVVRNNLQRKTLRVVSNQVGLTNIAAKYRLLAQTEPIVSDSNGYFTVVLPLLSPLIV